MKRGWQRALAAAAAAAVAAAVAALVHVLVVVVVVVGRRPMGLQHPQPGRPKSTDTKTHTPKAYKSKVTQK